MDVLCSQSDATDYTCNRVCGKRLECGHACRNKCSEPCSLKCCAPVDKTLPCGHEACYLSPDEIKCSLKCGAMLECGHPCAGTCCDCHLGRLHVHCQQNCGRQLVCGHTCGFPCASTCPPCIRKCNNFCVHSYCPKKCYEVCDPCMEPCQWQCDHYKCTQHCGQLCDRPPCNTPCTKKLRCGHDCISLCGEKCPDLCRVCDSEEVCEIFFGTEDDEDARFVMLEDCSHLFEVQSLDDWVLRDNESPGEIKFPSCPRCKTPIRTSLRYCNRVKQTLKDVAEIKKSQIGSKSDTLQQLRSLIDVANKSGCTMVFEDIKDIKKDLNEKNLHPYRLNAISVQIAVLTDVVRVKEIISTINASSVAVQLKSQHVICDAGSILNSLDVIKAFVMQDFLSQQQVSDVRSEVCRVSCAAKMCDLLCKLHINKCTLTSEDEQKMSQAVEQLHNSGWKQEKLSEGEEESFLQLIKQFSKSYRVDGLLKQEKAVIIKAIGLGKGHWYKCPNGHFYCIDRCGGAMQESKCPECDAVIGGQRHTLAAGNQHAPEMDGSRHSAWSEAANLANFYPEQLRLI